MPSEREIAVRLLTLSDGDADNCGVSPRRVPEKGDSSSDGGIDSRTRDGIR